MTAGAAPTGGWLVIAATSAAAAEQYAVSRGIAPCSIVTHEDLLKGPRWLREFVRERRCQRAVAHSVDWSRQNFPQAYELALLLAPVEQRYLADDRSGTTTLVGRSDAIRCVGRWPGDGVTAGACVAAEALRHAVSRRLGPRVAPRSMGQRPAVMAIWFGSLESSVGGSITHMSGMLAGFRALGLRVGLVTSGEPPAQLARVIDDVEIIPPLSRGGRVTNDVARLADNAAVRCAGLALTLRLKPSFIYQRHRPFLVAGADVARAARIPLVLEWNASEVWCREHWERSLSVERGLHPLLAAMEREMVRAATRILAVSTPAAEMALGVGADPGSVLVVPNAAHVAEIEQLTQGVSPRSNGRPLVGWIGSFGPWHGATVLVAALGLLADEVDLLMIGDGSQRQACQRQAERLGLTPRIEWSGSLPHDTAVRRLAGCDVLASPHEPLDGQPFFGSPTKLFEYMAIGRPIVASDLEQLGEVLKDHRTAVLVEPGDAVSLAAGIAQVLAMDGGGAALGDAARRDARDHHDWMHRAEAVLRSLRDREEVLR